MLVPRDAVRFPKIPDVKVPGYVYEARRLDLTIEPPRLGKPYASLVSQVDADGNETGGVRTPFVEVPLGTYTGWNLRDAETGAPDTLAGNLGSFFPLARSRQEQLDRKDPRPAIDERYQSREEYLRRFRAAAERLVEKGFLRKEDVGGITSQAGEQWDKLRSGAKT
jgi:hypothetical protein